MIYAIFTYPDFITAALQVAGLVALAGFWLLYFVRYHRAERERRRLAGRLLTMAVLLHDKAQPLSDETVRAILENGRTKRLRCINCGVFPWEPRA